MSFLFSLAFRSLVELTESFTSVALVINLEDKDSVVNRKLLLDSQRLELETISRTDNIFFDCHLVRSEMTTTALPPLATVLRIVKVNSVITTLVANSVLQVAIKIREFSLFFSLPSILV